ncbi:polysaccharide pyruvyl transferase family protein [Alteromonas macleodii]|uniref:polysaccharide pyruvyl transferase family protein n=1 Tax=Alteromonas macleodii TaxID=28108 RepID=UPI00314009BE|tara:strand:- start:1444 stop:2430 length:987 start_codon:yes stop_codon:yes gene_type:complete
MNNEQLIKELQTKTKSVFQSLVGDCDEVPILDFPDIKNVGDSAIWLGEVEYLKNFHGVKPGYVSTIKSYDPAVLKRMHPEGNIFIHGGGNFGDIWYGHQLFREKVMSDFPDRHIIQFPQSIHFESAEKLEKTKRAIGSHGNFSLLVRDKISETFANEHFDCNVALCPDMAFSIGKLTPKSSVEFPVLAMLREDKEINVDLVGNSTTLNNIPCEDWITENKYLVKKAKFTGYLKSASTLDQQRCFASALHAAAENRFARGIKQISRGERIITDRLHVHICSLLLGKQHAVLDNSYRKINNFISAFYPESELVYRATSLNDAIDWSMRES